MSDLIDTTEMYLRTIHELVEEGVPPLRARIAERLKHSGPTVSQTVARMERDGLLTVTDDRLLQLSPRGRVLASRVMRKHRLAERLLIDVIGLEWHLVHTEACRWEHVISADVEKRLVAMLDNPVESPYGNPIPALEELGGPPAPEQFRDGAEPLSHQLTSQPVRVTLRRMSEYLQNDPALMRLLADAGVRPGNIITARAVERQLEVVAAGAAGCRVELEAADHLFVGPAQA
ncbi:MAG: metal-dependent transcriptional regulator [Micropruina sp.]